MFVYRRDQDRMNLESYLSGCANLQINFVYQMKSEHEGWPWMFNLVSTKRILKAFYENLQITYSLLQLYYFFSNG